MIGADLRTAGLTDLPAATAECGDNRSFRGLAAEAAVSSGIGGGGRKRFVTDWTPEFDLPEPLEVCRLGNGGGVGDTNDVPTTQNTGDADCCRGAGAGHTDDVAVAEKTGDTDRCRGEGVGDADDVLTTQRTGDTDRCRGGGVIDADDVVVTGRTGDNDRCRGLGNVETGSRLPADELLLRKIGDTFRDRVDCKDATKL